MTTEQHLDAIVARCNELLAIAKKRTPEWRLHKEQDYDDPRQDVYVIADKSRTVAEINEWGTTNEQKLHNATFIAAIAGPAEAGWRATLLAIEGLRGYANNWNNDNCLNHIIAAWPIETLTT